MSAAERVLVVGPSWVGDMVMAQSLYRLLRSRGAEIDVLAPAWSLPLLERMPEVREGIELPVGHGELGLGKRWRLGRSLRGKAYTQAIVLPRSLKAALVPFFAAIPRRTGFLGESRRGLINDVRPFDTSVLDQTIKRFAALGCAAGEALPQMPLPRLESPPHARRAVLERLGLAAREGTVALMPGAEYGIAKQWPYYAELAARLSAEGRQVWVLGSAKEAPLGEQIAAADAGGRIRNLCGATRLEEAVDVLASVGVAVTNDSGLMHVAAAVGAHVVAIYGSSSPAFTPALTVHKSVLHLGLACSPCFARTCRYGHLRCLRELSVESVHAAVRAAGADGSAGENRAGGAVR
jgi:heptosyltransferase-2